MDLHEFCELCDANRIFWKVSARCTDAFSTAMWVHNFFTREGLRNHEKQAKNDPNPKRRQNWNRWISTSFASCATGLLYSSSSHRVLQRWNSAPFQHSKRSGAILVLSRKMTKTTKTHLSITCIAITRRRKIICNIRICRPQRALLDIYSRTFPKILRRAL
jgi:hypothetical protein